MTTRTLAHLAATRLGGRLALWRRATGGVAAVEFALILPVMLTMFFGLSEVTLAINVDRKLTLLSRSLADLSSRKAQVVTSEMSNIFGAAAAIMRPYKADTTQMVVTSVLVTQSGSTYTGAVEWSCGKNLGAGANDLKVRAANSSYPVPDGFKSPTTKSFILVESLHPYEPVFGKIITGTIRLRETTPWPVRNAEKVKGPNPCPT